jgi:putative oxidoreductase
MLRTVARPLLAAVFLIGGTDTLRDPQPRVDMAGPVLQPLVGRAPGDALTLVRANAAVQVAAGALLATGVLARPAALTLAASLVPTTLGGHRFWEHDGPARAQHRTHLLKNAAILGGLLAVAG